MSTVRQPLLCLAVLGLLAGCAGSVAINETERASLKNNSAPIQTLLYTSLGSNGLMLTTKSTAMAFAGAGFLAIKNGKEWTEEHGIVHPMTTLRDRMVSKLKADLGVYNFKHLTNTIDVGNDAPDKLKAQLGNGLLLDFTGTYQVIYYIADGSRYHMYYNARARLVRLDDEKILWQGNCRTDIEDPDNRPSYEELQSNKAARLKEWLGRGATECSNQLANQFFGRN